MYIFLINLTYSFAITNLTYSITASLSFYLKYIVLNILVFSSFNFNI